MGRHQTGPGNASLLPQPFWKQRKEAKELLEKHEQQKAAAAAAPATQPLQLQAYERLILLADRIALPHVIGRSNQPGMGLKDMQYLLVNTIRQEYEHNITQQIYVSPEAWEAVKNLKEQNIRFGTFRCFGKHRPGIVDSNNFMCMIVFEM